jgi:DNA primase
MSKLPQAFIDELLAKIDIVQIISSRIQTSKSGHEYHALCPFHNEKTPSFTISPKKNFYYCFGCGASGNAIGFIMNYDQIDFRAATIQLAESISLAVPLETENQAQDYKKNQLTKQFLGNVLQYYIQQLSSNKNVQQYLTKRGISKATVNQFKLGLSPQKQPNWPQLLNNKDSLTLLEEGGLVYKNKNQEYRTRFLGRLIFPIHNIQGEVVGFGARKLRESDLGPKYINSPETNIFKKSFELYGLHEAKKALKTITELIVVEGYMDVIALAEHSINNAVATLGTAINKQHITTLLKYTEQIIFCFDGDNAGKRAAWKALLQILPFMDRGIYVYFIFLPENQDPDTIVKKHGKEKFIEHLNKKKSATDFFLQEITKNCSSISEKTKAYKNAEEIIATISNGVFKNLLQDQLEKKLGAKPNTSVAETIKKSTINLDDIEIIISMIIQNPESARDIVIPELLLKTKSNKIKWLELIVDTIKNKENINTAILLQQWQDHKAYPWLISLTTKQHLILNEDFQQNIKERLNFINNKLIQTKIDAIIRLAKSEGLNTDEKQALYELIKLKNKFKRDHN